MAVSIALQNNRTRPRLGISILAEYIVVANRSRLFELEHSYHVIAYQLRETLVYQNLGT